jgi:hypothetical protein
MHSPRPFIRILDELMEMRARGTQGQLFRDLFGAERFQDMSSFFGGFGWCCGRNGIPDDEYGVFIEWLRDTREEFPEGWPDYYVAVCDGDHEKAMRRWLEFVAEFRELRRRHPEPLPPPPPEDPPPPPPSTPERYYSLLDRMMEAHARAQRGAPLWLCCGTQTLPALAAHIRGFLRCCERNGFPDIRWLAFTRWLARARGLQPDTWVQRILQDVGDDHEKAMMRVLTLAFEYVHEYERASGPTS